MKNQLNITHKIEKVVEENSLLILLDTKVIIKNKNQRIGIYLNLISNVRLIKHRDLSPSVIVLTSLLLFYIFYLSPLNLGLKNNILCGAGITVIFLFSFFIKKYTYKLLINQGNFRFNEIIIAKNNSIHAENFILNFKNRKFNKSTTPETVFHQLKEAL